MGEKNINLLLKNHDPLFITEESKLFIQCHASYTTSETRRNQVDAMYEVELIYYYYIFFYLPIISYLRWIIYKKKYCIIEILKFSLLKK